MHTVFFTVGFKTPVPEYCADDICNIFMSHLLNVGSALKEPMFIGELFDWNIGTRGSLDTGEAPLSLSHFTVYFGGHHTRDR